MDKPVGMPLSRRARQFFGMTDIETVINQRGGQMAGKIRRNGLIPGLLRFVILGAGGLPVFWRGCRQRQNTVLDSLT